MVCAVRVGRERAMDVGKKTCPNMERVAFCHMRKASSELQAGIELTVKLTFVRINRNTQVGYFNYSRQDK
jgi:hypothetical protein